MSIEIAMLNSKSKRLRDERNEILEGLIHTWNKFRRHHSEMMIGSDFRNKSKLDMNDKIEAKDVLKKRLSQLNKEKLELEIDLERDVEECKQRCEVNDDSFVDQQYWRTEIYKYEFCIEELERCLSLIK